MRQGAASDAEIVAGGGPTDRLASRSDTCHSRQFLCSILRIEHYGQHDTRHNPALYR